MHNAAAITDAIILKHWIDLRVLRATKEFRAPDALFITRRDWDTLTADYRPYIQRLAVRPSCEYLGMKVCFILSGEPNVGFYFPDYEKENP